MAFTYTPGAATDRDRIRIRIGDTSSSRPATQRLEDEEIDDLILTSGGFRSAAIAAARALLAKMAALPSEKRVGDLELTWDDRLAGLRAVIRELEADVVAGAKPYAAGISRADRAASEADTDRIGVPFKTGQLDNPRAS